MNQLIREVRKSRGETMVVFAERLGVKQSTVSDYESGKMTPRATVLMRLHDLAQTAFQRAQIRDAIGPAGDQLRTSNEVEQAKQTADFERDSAGAYGLSEADLMQRFRELCIEIMRTGEVPLWLVSQMELWLEIRAEPDGRHKFTGMFEGLTRAMGTLAEGKKSIKGPVEKR